MSCGPVEGQFRLLDAYVGWSESHPPTHLVGLDDPAGLRLAAIDPQDIGSAAWQHLLPPRLARGCGPCDNYLLTPSRLLRRSSCNRCWEPVWTAACDPRRFVHPVAVAAWQRFVAVADADAGRVWVWSREGELLVAEIAASHVAALAFGRCGELWIATGNALTAYGVSGEPLGRRIGIPAGAGRPLSLVQDASGGLWLLTRSSQGALHLWHAASERDPLQSAGNAQLAAAGLPPTQLVAVSEHGFCEADAGSWTWEGHCATAEEIGLPTTPALHTEGWLHTLPLDSGKPRCRWHRIALDADLPAGTGIEVHVATTDTEADTPDGADWRPSPAGATEFLLDQPPGRFLRVRIRLLGDGLSTPVLRRVRVEFPRSTSLDGLPPVYRDNPRAEDFSERFLALFDAGMAELDAAIEEFPAALDVASARDELLPWLASFHDLVFDTAWDAQRQRRVLRAMPRLYGLRGTVEGLRLAIRLVFDVDAAIQELAPERAWGALGRGNWTRLGMVRLFGQSRARLRTGHSTLGQAPLRSRGNPDLDAVGTGAWRFRVLVPPGQQLSSAAAQQRLARLVDTQKPAHTQASVRVGGTGFVLGLGTAVGIDTSLGPLPGAVLGDGQLRLGRTAVLRAGRRGPRASFLLGQPLAVGAATLLE